MRTDNSETPESIDMAPDAYRLGVDAAGREHWHSPRRDRVWIVRDGELAHAGDVANIAQWKQNVREECGWETVQPVEESTALASIADDVLEAA